MRVSFLGQPFIAFGGWTADWLRLQLNDSAIVQLKIASAWVKRSGLSRMQPALEGFKNRGGHSAIILGIDEGGATSQGLQLARDLFDEVHVFSDPSSRTYHPKVYLLFGKSVAFLLVGSNNLTAGGLWSNYEGALLCQLDLAETEDTDLFNRVLEWFALMYADTNACKRLNEELLETLVGDTRYQITDEDRGRSRRAAEDEDSDAVATKPRTQSVFGSSTSPKKGMAPARTPRLRVPRSAVPAPFPLMPSIQPPSTMHGILLRWYKKMSFSDAQQPRAANSARTGNLKLTKADQDIDHRTFFRQDMFGDALWATTVTKRGDKEEAVVAFDVTVAGVHHGQFTLKIDHADYRVASQGNVPTWLHWGTLTPILQATNFTGAWVAIERRLDGTYTLEITKNTPSPTIQE